MITASNSRGTVEHDTFLELDTWIAHSHPGDHKVYAVGFLVLVYDSERGWPPELHKICQLLQANAREGIVALTQNRLRENVYEYIVTRVTERKHDFVR